MINLRLNRRSSPRGAERNLLGAKRDHDDSGKTPADLMRTYTFKHIYSSALHPLREISYNIYI